MSDFTDSTTSAPQIARAAFHELNNHLGVAMLNASTLRRRLGELEPAASTNLEMLVRSLDAMRALSCQLSDLVDLLQNAAPLELSPIELESVLGAVADQSPGRAVPLRDSVAGVRVLGQRDWTVRLFATVLGAAVQGPPAPLEVTADRERVRFSVDLPLDPEAPGASDMALAIGERLVWAHQGTWHAGRQSNRLLVDFTLPAAP